MQHPGLVRTLADRFDKLNGDLYVPANRMDFSGANASNGGQLTIKEQ